MNRRQVLKSATSVLAVATLPLVLSRCGSVSTTPTSTGTTVNVNTAQINAYAQAAENMTQLILSIPGVPIPPTDSALIAAAGKTISGDIAAFATATNGDLTISVNTSSPPSAIDSLLTDSETILTDVRTAVGTSTNATVVEYVNALATLVSLFQAAINTPTAAAALTASTPMSEAQALQTLRVSQYKTLN